jgi:cytoskeletal protein RodZ
MKVRVWMVLLFDLVVAVVIVLALFMLATIVFMAMGCSRVPDAFEVSDASIPRSFSPETAEETASSSSSAGDDTAEETASSSSSAGDDTAEETASSSSSAGDDTAEETASSSSSAGDDTAEETASSSSSAGDDTAEETAWETAEDTASSSSSAGETETDSCDLYASQIAECGECVPCDDCRTCDGNIGFTVRCHIPIFVPAGGVDSECGFNCVLCCEKDPR